MVIRSLRSIDFVKPRVKTLNLESSQSRSFGSDTLQDDGLRRITEVDIRLQRDHLLSLVQDTTVLTQRHDTGTAILQHAAAILTAV